MASMRVITRPSMEVGKVAVIGGGYLGERFAEYFSADRLAVDVGDLEALRNLLIKTKPQIVINAAAKTRTNELERPEHQAEAFRVNVGGAANSSLLAGELGFRLVQLSTGMQFDGFGPEGKGWDEEATPNPGSYYAWTKAWADSLLKPFAIQSRILIVRLSLPISNVSNPRNLLDKLPRFSSALDAQSSMSTVEDLLSATRQLLEQEATGIYNVVNPGTISFWEIVRMMVEERMLPADHPAVSVTKETFDRTVSAAGGAYQPSTFLNTDKLQAAGIRLPEIHLAIRNCIRNFQQP